MITLRWIWRQSVKLASSGNEGIAPIILELCSTFGWVVSLMHQLLHLRPKKDRGWVGHRIDLKFRRRQKSLAPAGVRLPDFPASSLLTVPTALIHLICHLLTDMKTCLNLVSNYQLNAHFLYSITIYTECPRRKGPNFGRVFLRSNYTDITQNTYIQSSMVTKILAREVWNFNSYYSLIDYQIHIETGRNMWFL